MRRHGYRVLTRNCKTDRGEIDIVCRDGSVLVFVEVRARSSEVFGRPAESIDTRKEQALRAAAEDYLHLLKRDDIAWRIDVVEVRLKAGEPPSCTLLRNILA